MHNLKKLALIIALLAMGICATANAATTAEDKAEFARTATNYDTSISNSAAAETRLEIIPLPGAAGFPSYVDFNNFTKGCAQLDSATVILKKNGKNISLICHLEDGGSVGVTTTENEATVSIHQTTQMNGKAITTLNNSFNIVVPLSFPIDDKCAEKIKEATEAKDSGSFGDVKIKFNPHGFEATCQSTCPVLSSFEANFKALDNFLTGHQ